MSDEKVYALDVASGDVTAAVVFARARANLLRVVGTLEKFFDSEAGRIALQTSLSAQFECSHFGQIIADAAGIARARQLARLRAEAEATEGGNVANLHPDDAAPVESSPQVEYAQEPASTGGADEGESLAARLKRTSGVEGQQMYRVPCGVIRVRDGRSLIENPVRWLVSFDNLLFWEVEEMPKLSNGDELRAEVRRRAAMPWAYLPYTHDYIAADLVETICAG